MIKTKYPWAPLLADLACPNNGDPAQELRGQGHEGLLQGAGRHRARSCGTLGQGQRAPAEEEPDLLARGQARARHGDLEGRARRQLPQRADPGRPGADQREPAVLEHRPAQGQPSVEVDLFPSTKTDYILMNQNEKPYDDVHVRRAISYAIDREALIKTLLFGNGTPANSFLMPTVPFYDKDTPGQQLRHGQGQGGDGAVDGAERLHHAPILASSGDSTDPAHRAGAAVLAQGARHHDEDPERRPERRCTTCSSAQKYEISHSYWTMDIADPDELVQFAVRPGGRRPLLRHQLQQPAGACAGARRPSRPSTPPSGRSSTAELRSRRPTTPSCRFLFYSPFRYAVRTKVQGFQV